MGSRGTTSSEPRASCRRAWRRCTAPLAGLLVAAACVTPVDPNGQGTQVPEGGAAGVQADAQSGGSPFARGGALVGGTGGAVDADSGGGMPSGDAGREPGAAGMPKSAGAGGVTPAGGSGAGLTGGSGGSGATGGSGSLAGFAGGAGEVDAAGAAGAGGSGDSGGTDGFGGSGGDSGAGVETAGNGNAAAGTDGSGGTTSGTGATGGSGASSGTDGAGGTAGESGATHGAGGSSGGSACAADSGIEVRYQPSGTSSEIQAEIRIFNASAPSTTIADYAVRYYLTQNEEATLRPVVNHTGAQTAGGYSGATASAAAHAYTPAVAGAADTYIEFVVDSSTPLSPGDYVRIQWQAGSGFTQTNDFSFDADADFSSAHNRITIHVGAEHIYGCLPE